MFPFLLLPKHCFFEKITFSVTIKSSSSFSIALVLLNFTNMLKSLCLKHLPLGHRTIPSVLKYCREAVLPQLPHSYSILNHASSCCSTTSGNHPFRKDPWALSHWIPQPCLSVYIFFNLSCTWQWIHPTPSLRILCLPLAPWNLYFPPSSWVLPLNYSLVSLIPGRISTYPRDTGKASLAKTVWPNS